MQRSAVFWTCLLATFVAEAAGPDAGKPEVTPVVFDSASGLGVGWSDLGWAPRKIDRGAPISLKLSGRGGWIAGAESPLEAFGELRLRLRVPAALLGAVVVRLDNSRGENLPEVPLPDVAAGPDGWSEVSISFAQLDPRGLPFNRLELRAFKDVPDDPFLIDVLAFSGKPAPRPQPMTPTRVAAPLPPPLKPGRTTKIRIDCTAPVRPISPLIYGIGSTGAPSEEYLYRLGITARRWGGLVSSRYNWALGNAWNTGFDGFFRNTNLLHGSTVAYERFLEESTAHGVQSALTVPILGWVAKDSKSFSFPVSQFGQQQYADANGAGNGLDRRGGKIVPGTPTNTSVAAPPEFIARWVAAIRAKDRGGPRSVREYILDNEPMLWNVNHRDVHPKPLSYDELLERSIAYGAAIRQVDPEAIIAGPAEWGWFSFFDSAVNEWGTGDHSDRRAHGNVPLLAWYLRRMREYQERKGVHILDLVDVHFFPQARDMGPDAHGHYTSAGAALRIRSTRALWDPTYLDESWIKDRVRLIPRLREWIKENNPGLGISIGAYNFGGEDHISGGLAVAEALGRFGMLGIDSAFYWKAPPQDSAAAMAFRAYRDYDGQGSRFPELSIPSRSSDKQLSVFTARDEHRSRIVTVLLNLDPQVDVGAELELAGCPATGSVRAFSYRGITSDFTQLATTPGRAGAVLPRYSMTVIEFLSAQTARSQKKTR